VVRTLSGVHGLPVLTRLLLPHCLSLPPKAVYFPSQAGHLIEGDLPREGRTGILIHPLLEPSVSKCIKKPWGLLTHILSYNRIHITEVPFDPVIPFSEICLKEVIKNHGQRFTCKLFVTGFF
jgi:hypothetical protein